jgi:signal transduction histidine kinase
MTDALQTPTRTVLYIEDDPASRLLVERTLRYAGYRVLVADCGLVGIDVALREEPDLILTDINLPDLTGREITTRLRSEARFRRTPIVALTAAVLRDQRDMAMAAGLTGYLTKPLDIVALPGQIDYYLKGGKDTIDQQALSEAHTRYTQELVQRLEARVRELEQRNSELRRLDHMKDSFIQVTAHELRTPLTLIYGYSRLVEDNPQLKTLMQHEPNTRMLIEGMGHAIDRMQTIVNEILTVSRIITNRIDLSIGPTNFTNVVQRVLRSFDEALKQRRINVRFDPAEWPQRMLADWELMELVMRNLIGNAIKYTPDGGKIVLAARIENDTTLRFSIKDSGIGISKDDLQTIFERFATGSDPQFHSTSKTAFRGGGIGLGLAVSKGVIEAHSGRIWAESAGFDPEKCPGSEFIVVVPIIAPGFTG